MACPYDSSQINAWLATPFTTEWVREQGQPLETGEHVMHTKTAFYTEFLFHTMFLQTHPKAVTCLGVAPPQLDLWYGIPGPRIVAPLGLPISPGFRNPAICLAKASQLQRSLRHE
ncbi:hypothetical protein ACSS6W_010430 [Trichoderma asperelloides]